MAGLGKLKSQAANPQNARLVKPIERRWRGRPSHGTYRSSVKLNAPETCWVEGCDRLAEYIPYLLKSYEGGGMNVTFTEGPDRDCLFLCGIHREEDIQSRTGGGGVRYTDRSYWGANLIIYRPVLQP